MGIIICILRSSVHCNHELVTNLGLTSQVPKCMYYFDAINVQNYCVFFSVTLYHFFLCRVWTARRDVGWQPSANCGFLPREYKKCGSGLPLSPAAHPSWQACTTRLWCGAGNLGGQPGRRSGCTYRIGRWRRKQSIITRALLCFAKGTACEDKSRQRRKSSSLYGDDKSHALLKWKLKLPTFS